MSPDRTLQLLLIARDLSQKLRSVLDFAAVVAIVAILIAAALQAYADGVVRSQVIEGFNMASTTRIDMAVYRAQTGVWPRTPGEVANSSVGDESMLGRYVGAIEIDADGSVSVLMSGKSAAPAIRGRRLIFEPAGDATVLQSVLRWRCRQSTPDTALSLVDAAYLPLACKEY